MSLWIQCVLLPLQDVFIGYGWLDVGRVLWPTLKLLVKASLPTNAAPLSHSACETDQSNLLSASASSAKNWDLYPALQLWLSQLAEEKWKHNYCHLCSLFAKTGVYVAGSWANVGSYQWFIIWCSHTVGISLKPKNPVAGDIHLRKVA